MSFLLMVEQLAPDTPSANQVVIYPKADGKFYTKDDTGVERAVSAAAATSTDNAVVRFDGTVGSVQNSGVIIDDSNNVSGVGTLATTGNVTISKSTPQFTLDIPAAGTERQISGKTNGSGRWQLILGDSAAESGGNAGSDFTIQSRTDADAQLQNVLRLIRSTGTAIFAGLLDLSAAAAGQIKFPATQNASADANTLDDYEEGTWTPTVGGTATYTAQEGIYIKVGRSVAITSRLLINVIGTGSQSSVSGIPFTPTASGGVSIGSFDTLATSIVSVTASIADTNPQISLQGLTAAGISQNTTVIMTSGTLLTFGGNFRA